MNNKMKSFLLSVGLLAASTTCFGQSQDCFGQHQEEQKRLSSAIADWEWFDRLPSRINNYELAHRLAYLENTEISKITGEIEAINADDNELASSQSKYKRIQLHTDLSKQLTMLQQNRDALSDFVEQNKKNLSNDQIERADAAIEAADNTLEQHNMA